jgi:hypothetical protein
MMEWNEMNAGRCAVIQRPTSGFAAARDMTVGGSRAQCGSERRLDGCARIAAKRAALSQANQMVKRGSKRAIHRNA